MSRRNPYPLPENASESVVLARSLLLSERRRATYLLALGVASGVTITLGLLYVSGWEVSLLAVLSTYLGTIVLSVWTARRTSTVVDPDESRSLRERFNAMTDRESHWLLAIILGLLAAGTSLAGAAIALSGSR